MTARGKLTLTFCAILFLFGVNFGVYLWSANQRNVAVGNLDRALSRVAVVSAVRQDLDNMSKEIALLSQLKFEEGERGPDPKEQQAFALRLTNLKSKITQLQGLWDPARRQEVDQLSRSYDELAQSWKNFYEYLGAQQSKAVTELAVRGDPLSERVMKQLMPDVERNVNEQAQAAKIAVHGTMRRADDLTFFVFIISLVLSSLLAVLALQSRS